ncbi:urease accessory protein UreF [Actibacterium atlanticum]|uniref:Urease accessory protein UreF n=1 Tax=Actibacterium atlanticum TaxID=1461693 RepID=A0A058ZNS5_9RHOB|nr:urease accessory protein UreF [Actibacterium atlanticum]
MDECGLNTDLLTLMQWMSPAFPVGGYAYSHGLEQAIDDGAITDADTLFDWLVTVLEHGTGMVDATLLCLALKGEDMADTARALASSKERYQEAEAQGQAFTSAVNGIYGEQTPPAPLPVAVGIAARRLDLIAPQVAAHYLHAFASNLVSAAVRFVPLGQTDGQRVLKRLHGVIEGVAARASQATLDDLGSAALGSDMASMRHETMEVRIFKT